MSFTNNIRGFDVKVQGLCTRFFTSCADNMMQFLRQDDLVSALTGSTVMLSHWIQPYAAGTVVYSFSVQVKAAS